MFGSVGSRGGHGRAAPPSTTVLTSGTALTYTVPQGIHLLRVRVVGPGGGGGGADGTNTGASGGGGAGGYAEKTLNVVPGQTFSYTIGAFGAGGSAGNNAGSPGGSATTWDSGGSPVVGNLGSGGGSMATGTSLNAIGGGAGGTATGGAINITGQNGYSGLRIAANSAIGGTGASSQLGGGGYWGPGIVGQAGNGYGAGGGGAAVYSGADVAGGAGSSGVIIIEEYP